MADKILVAYASVYGATAEVAEAVGRTLRENGAAVDVRPAKEVKDLSSYKAVLLGTSVRAGRPLRPAIDFVRRHQAALSRVPVAYFVVCMAMMEDTEAHRQEALGYLKSLEERVKPVDVGLFGGALLNPSKIGGFSGFIIRSMLKNMEKPDGFDSRNWDGIRSWTVDLSAKIVPN